MQSWCEIRASHAAFLPYKYLQVQHEVCSGQDSQYFLGLSLITEGRVKPVNQLFKHPQGTEPNAKNREGLAFWLLSLLQEARQGFLSKAFSPVVFPVLIQSSNGVNLPLTLPSTFKMQSLSGH